MLELKFGINYREASLPHKLPQLHVFSTGWGITD